MQNSLRQRRIGVEIEYSNLPLERSARIISGLFGGTIEKRSRYDYRVTGTELGDFALELDLKLLKRLAADPTFARLSEIFGDPDALAIWIESTASMIVPYEIAAPPVAITRLDQIDRLVEQLRLAGATGTSHAIQYAFGMHLNIEPPALDVETVLRHFRAFLMLQLWLERQAEVNITRKISPFIGPFDETYVRKVLDPDYRPDCGTFIDDYIDYHPTRNLSLDLLPLFAYWDAARVFAQLPDEKIKPRPAFHYRLPNSKIDLFRWRVSDEWELWRIVELLADNPEQFERLRDAYMESLEDLFGDDDLWIERSHRCVLDLLSP